MLLKKCSVSSVAWNCCRIPGCGTLSRSRSQHLTVLLMGHFDHHLCVILPALYQGESLGKGAYGEVQRPRATVAEALPGVRHLSPLSYDAGGEV